MINYNLDSCETSGNNAYQCPTPAMMNLLLLHRECRSVETKKWTLFSLTARSLRSGPDLNVKTREMNRWKKVKVFIIFLFHILFRLFWRGVSGAKWLSHFNTRIIHSKSTKSWATNWMTATWWGIMESTHLKQEYILIFWRQKYQNYSSVKWSSFHETSTIARHAICT